MLKSPFSLCFLLLEPSSTVPALRTIASTFAVHKSDPNIPSRPSGRYLRNYSPLSPLAKCSINAFDHIHEMINGVTAASLMYRSMGYSQVFRKASPSEEERAAKQWTQSCAGRIKLKKIDCRANARAGMLLVIFDGRSNLEKKDNIILKLTFSPSLQLDHSKTVGKDYPTSHCEFAIRAGLFLILLIHDSCVLTRLHCLLIYTLIQH